MLVIASEVQNRGTDHYVCETVGKWHVFNRANLKILRWQVCSKRSRECANVINARRILVQRKDLAAFAQQVDQISSVTASGVEHAHAGGDVSPQNLIEDVNIDLPELLLYAQGHTAPFLVGFEKVRRSRSERIAVCSSRIAQEFSVQFSDTGDSAHRLSP